MQCHHTGEHHPTAMLLLLLPLAVLGATPVHDAPTELGPNVTGAVPLKVMPLGDSITYGCGDNCSSLCTPTLPCADCLTNGSYTPCALCSSGYRLPLWRRLTTASIDPIMVGPLTGGPADAPLTATHHAGWPGIRISGTASPDHTMGLVQAADIVGGWGVFAAQSEVILLHIGTNDILQNEYANASAAAADMGLQLSELLTVIHVHAPLSHILVASIISFAHTPKYEAFNAQAEAYNAALPLVVAGFVAAGGLATFVDMAAESAGTCAKEGSCCPGGIHPTVVGYEGMAEVWSKALVPVASKKRVEAATHQVA